jgi:hypothetical protein
MSSVLGIHSSFIWPAVCPSKGVLAGEIVKVLPDISQSIPQFVPFLDAAYTKFGMKAISSDRMIVDTPNNLFNLFSLLCAPCLLIS